jgi:hypothetical protein
MEDIRLDVSGGAGYIFADFAEKNFHLFVISAARH